MNDRILNRLARAALLLLLGAAVARDHTARAASCPLQNLMRLERVSVTEDGAPVEWEYERADVTVLARGDRAMELTAAVLGGGRYQETYREPPPPRP